MPASTHCFTNPAASPISLPPFTSSAWRNPPPAPPEHFYTPKYKAMKGTNMKTKLTASLLAALCALALGAQAQDGPPPDGGPDGQGGPGGPGGPGMHRHRPIPPIVRALDVNHDGIIDSNEIANASAELKTLDKKGLGYLTMDELMGPRPHRPGGQDASEGQGTNEPSGPPGADQEGPGPGGPGGPG